MRLEGLVHIWAALQWHGMGDHKAWIDLACFVIAAPIGILPTQPPSTPMIDTIPKLRIQWIACLSMCGRSMPARPLVAGFAIVGLINPSLRWWSGNIHGSPPCARARRMRRRVPFQMRLQSRGEDVLTQPDSPEHRVPSRSAARGSRPAGNARRSPR